jgi:hypothetical protein
MSPAVLGLVVAAAFAHAGWNLLVADSDAGSALLGWTGARDRTAAVDLGGGRSSRRATRPARARGDRNGRGSDLVAGAALVCRNAPRIQGIVFALLTGLTIAAYTLWDKQAVDQTRLPPIAYFWGSLVVSALLLAPWAIRNGRTLRGIVVTSWASSR